MKNALARSRLLWRPENMLHHNAQAPGGAQLLALDKAVHPLAAAEGELPLELITPPYPLAMQPQTT